MIFEPRPEEKRGVEGEGSHSILPGSSVSDMAPGRPRADTSLVPQLSPRFMRPKPYGAPLGHQDRAGAREAQTGSLHRCPGRFNEEDSAANLRWCQPVKGGGRVGEMGKVWLGGISQGRPWFTLSKKKREEEGRGREGRGEERREKSKAKTRTKGKIH